MRHGHSIVIKGESNRLTQKRKGVVLIVTLWGAGDGARQSA
jgi:hypothetical protein